MIANSFGINPVSGGIPASEHRSTKRIIYVFLIFWFMLICVVDFIFEYAINRKIGVTVIKYNTRYDMQIVGLADKMIIHPRCLTDE